MDPKQTIKREDRPGWAEMQVMTSESYGDELASKTVIRTAAAFPIVDISIEEYTGTSRRAKFTSVRLQEPAARELLVQLVAKFAPPNELEAFAKRVDDAMAADKTPAAQARRDHQLLEQQQQRIDPFLQTR